jgi:hypothetical protein
MVRDFAARTGFGLACNVGTVRAAWSAALLVEIAEEANLAEIAVQVLLSELERYELLGVVQGALGYPIYDGRALPDQRGSGNASGEP